MLATRQRNVVASAHLHIVLLASIQDLDVTRQRDRELFALHCLANLQIRRRVVINAIATGWLIVDRDMEACVLPLIERNSWNAQCCCRTSKAERSNFVPVCQSQTQAQQPR